MSETYDYTGLYVFLYILFGVVFAVVYLMMGDLEKRNIGKTILLTPVWPIPTIYFLLKEIIKFTTWFFSCILAVFIPEQKQLIATGWMTAEQVETNNVKYIQPVYNDQCKHCGSRRQLGSVCNRCGAPL